MRINVTIARQLGSGGSFLGESIAQALKVRCVDREILSETAKRLACHESQVEDCEETVPTFWERLLVGLHYGPPEAVQIPPTSPPPAIEEIFTAETEVMKQIAIQEDCVIVGRAAAHVLPPHPGLINIFLYAPLEFRVPRVMEYYNASTEEQARALIARSDHQRQKFVFSMTGCDNSEASNYHICIDTSSLQLEEISALLVDFIQRRLNTVRQYSTMD